jgi:aminoglycoside phosphotransferase (APT) family kinase protein
MAPARVGDQIAGCTPAEAERILRELAAAQAVLWNSPTFEPLFWIARTDVITRATHLTFRRNRRAFFEEFGHRLPDSISRFAEWLDANAIAVMERLGTPPLALMHGDYRLDNLFFENAGGGPTLTAIDWQGVGCARPPLDVAYFVSGNLEAPVAVEAESSLLRAYHDELLARGIVGYPFEECRRDYELSKVFHLYRLMMGGNMIDLSHERGQVLLDRIFERHIALLPDGDLDELL